MNNEPPDEVGEERHFHRRERRLKGPYNLDRRRASSQERCSSRVGSATEPNRSALRRSRMGITTRSTSSRRDEEDRRRFLAEGAAAARASARQAGRPPGEPDRLPGEPGRPPAEPEAPAPAADPAAMLAAPTEPEPRERQAGANRQYTVRSGELEQFIASSNRPLFADANAATQESPRSPSVNNLLLSGDRQPPLPIPLEPVTSVVVRQPQLPRPSQVTFSNQNRAASIHSRVSNITEARRKEAELEAAERLAEVKRQELNLEAELIKKRLETRLSLIEAEEGSMRNSASIQGSNHSNNRITQWIDESQSGEAGQAQKETNEAPPDYETPKRALNQNADPERRKRPRSLSRERLHRPNFPRADAFTPRTTNTQHTNEGTIAESMLHIFERMQIAARPTPKDIYELPVFYGNASEWRSFYNVYLETSKRYNFSDFENVARLRAALKGEAKACVQHILSTASKPELIVRILQRQYGRSEILLDRALEDLRRLPALGPTAQELNSFSIKVMNIVSTVIDLDKKHYTDNTMLVREVTDRLTPHIRSRWCEHACRYAGNDNPEILQLAEFLLKESEMEMRFCHARAPARRSGPSQDTSTSTRAAPARPPENKTYTYRPNYAPASKSRRPDMSKVSYAVKEESKQSSCLYCGGQHRTPECRKLLSQNIAARWDWAKMNRICFRCVDAKHRREHCRAKGCDVTGCPHPHHRLLHGEEATELRCAEAPPATAPAPLPRSAQIERPAARTQAIQYATTDDSRAPEARTYASISSHNVLLKVLPVTLTGPLGTAHVFAMLDDGSTISLLEEDIAEQIGLQGPESPLNVRGIGNIAHRSFTRTVKASVRPARGGAAHEVTFRTVSGLGLRSQTLVKERLMSYEHLQDLNEECYTTGVPQLLIGADHWHLLVPSELRTGGKDEPAAMKGPLGWVFFGTIPKVIKTNEMVVMHCRTESPDDDLDNVMKKHWAIESLGVKIQDNVKPADERALQLFERTVKKVSDRYEVGQLWSEDKPRLPPSFPMAYSRLRNLEARMDRDEHFAEEYSNHVRNLLEKGYAEKLLDAPVSDVAWYLLHFSVYNANKKKGRAVFDCAAKSQGHALNDFILQGPDLLQNLLGILLRFRERNFAVTADIQEMFLRIQIRRQDQPSQLFLWRGARRDCAPNIYKLSRVCFGCVSSPFLAHAVRNRNAKDNQAEYPEAVYDITTNHYMDDYVASYHDEEELVRVATQVRDSHAMAGFKLRDYASNSTRLLNEIEPELRKTEPTMLGDKQPKVLGMIWNPNSDTLSYNTNMLRVSEDVKSRQRAPTKRELLSAIMSIYDPLGLISNYVISAKILYQKVWGKCIGWDAPLQDEDKIQFFSWLDALRHVAALKIPRQYAVPGAAPRFTLHVFTDASSEAYCAVAYWRAEDERTKEVKVTLAAGKSRVCPIKVVTIPRLELTAAVLGLRLAQTILKEERYAVDNVTYWTDSKTVLCWVRDDARQYKPFVSFRISEIAESSDRNAWRWVPTRLNPADKGTRCQPSREINADDEWFTGPAFLRLPQGKWPDTKIGKESHDSLLERKLNVATATTETAMAISTSQERSPTAVLPDITRFSSYDRLINATAYVLLIVEKWLTKNRALQLKVSHLKQAENLWIQNSQRKCFPEEIRALSRGEQINSKSRIYKLAPELDNGVLKMKTRLGNAPVIYTTPQPIILDGHDVFVKLLITRAHRRSAHVHNEAVVNTLRREYWILSLRPAVKAVARSCQLCRVRRANPTTQPMGDLPAERLQPYQQPFTYSAQDYMGPLYVTIGRRREKRWVCLYTCLTSRAIHLEVVHSLSADSAIMALRRFAARRGWPRVMWSDNATCFRAAAIELKEAYEDWLPKMQEYGVQHRMEWKYIPPGNPSAGGAWERLIRTVKTALSYTLHTKAPKEELFFTILTEIEYIVNQRPLTHVPSDPFSAESLTPSHFLLLSTSHLPIYNTEDPDDRKHWRAAQALANHFWRRWVSEYLPLLAPRQSSGGRGRQVREGDVVIIADPNGPRSVWPRGLVVATHPGPDGCVRSADVRTTHGTLRRPTSRMAIITTSEEPCTRVSSDTGGEVVEDSQTN